MPNCPCPQFDIQKYKDKPYQETPCAKCFLSKQTTNTHKHSQLFDTDGVQSQQPAKRPQPVQVQDILPEKISPDTLAIIVQACQQNFILTLSNLVLKLTRLSKTYPVLFQILTYKMQHPQLSYFEIGRKLNPPCSKQNVLYHLSHAVRQFPQLEKSIVTDTRFSGGRYALKTIAQLASRIKQVQIVRRKLYEQNQYNTRKEFDELKRQLQRPYKVNIISEFDSYLHESDSGDDNVKSR